MKIPELDAFTRAEEQLKKHLASSPEFVEKLRELIIERNRRLEAANVEVRKHQVNAGPFKILRRVTSLDADKLYEEAGADLFEQLGGYVETVQVRKIDRTKFEALMNRGDIPKEIVDATLKVSVHYDRIPTYEIP